MVPRLPTILTVNGQAYLSYWNQTHNTPVPPLKRASFTTADRVVCLYRDTSDRFWIAHVDFTLYPHPAEHVAGKNAAEVLARALALWTSDTLG